MRLKYLESGLAAGVVGCKTLEVNRRCKILMLICVVEGMY
jgi:hypothetical protein